MTLAIDVSALNKSFGERRVVKDVSLQIEEGHITGFLGPNGSGKTTTLRMLCGLLTPDSGRGTVLGLDFPSEAAAIKRQTGYMTQRFSLYEDLTIEENLAFIARVYSLDHVRERVDGALEKLALQDRRKQLAAQLSGGWKQRLALAAATLHSPRLLLLDEPTAGVDPQARRDFWDEIHALSDTGITVLVSTHYMDEAERCHDIAYIFNGDLIARGTADKLIDDSRISSLTKREGPRADRLARDLQASPASKWSRRSARPSTSAAPIADRSKRRSGRSAAIPGAGVEVEPTPRGRIHPPDARTGATGRAKLHDGLVVLARSSRSFRRNSPSSSATGSPIAMILGIPILQLLLFGYAINTDPKHLPTAVLVQDQGDLSRSVLASLRNSEYFDIVASVGTPAELNRLIEQGKVQFAITIPGDFTRNVVRGDEPADPRRSRRIGPRSDGSRGLRPRQPSAICASP